MAGIGGFGGGGGGGTNNRAGNGGAGGAGGYGGGAGGVKDGGGGAGMGGAVFNSGGTVTITGSTFYRNTVSGGDAGGGGAGAGQGLGAGIANANGTMWVINSTITDNSADSGGGLFNYNGTLTVTNSTISGNTADQGGRGILTVGDGAGATAVINNTIIAQSDTNVSDLQSGLLNGATTVVIGLNNLLGTVAGPSTVSSLLGTVVGDPLLGPLQNYGGPTSTMALRAGSPAVNAGRNDAALDSLGNPLTTDQRGVLRQFGSNVDIGAYELQAFNMVVNTAADNTTANSTLSLREALDLANGSLSYNALSASEKTRVTPVAGSANTITFASSLNGSPLMLSTVGDRSVGSSAFLVNSVVAVDGPSGNITLSAAGAAMRLFIVTNPGNLTLQGLTLTGGAAAGNAGGNSSAGAGGGGAGLGGAILNQGTLMIRDSTLTGNTVQGGAGGTDIAGLGNGGGGGAGLNAVGGSATTDTGSAGGGPYGGLGGLPGGPGKNGGPGTAGGYGSGGGGGGVSGFTNGSGGHGGAGGFGGGGGGGGNIYYGYGGTGGFGGGGGGNSSIQKYLGYGAIPPGAGGFGGGGGGGSGHTGGGGGGGGAGMGGAIFNEGGAVIITNSTLVGNTAQGGAGGAGGSAGSGVGGALFNASGTLTVTGATIYGNSATSGGGLFNFKGALTVTNATISGNSATNGGGLYNYLGTLTVTNATISANSASTGGGLSTLGTANVTNTIVASQTSGGDVNGSLAFASSHNLIGGNPLLAPLGNYGGSTQTMALAGASPAIGAGTSAGAPTTDQRGFSRTGAVDIGAFQTSSLVVNTTGDVSLAGLGKLSLRVAVNLANLQGGADTITFDPTVFATPQTITLTAGSLALTDTATTTITGLGAALIRVSGNHADAVFQITNGASAALSGMAITAGSAALGGGVHNDGTVTLTDCTLIGNSASGHGGGLYNFGTATLINCTASGNSADEGGGVYNAGTATLINCTISGNSANKGGGIYHAGLSVTLLNTIVAGNSAPANTDVKGRFSSQGFNLVGATSDSTGWIASDLTNRNALLAPLDYYGGLTLTMALLTSSPAIDAGSSVGAPATDERGVGRVGHVDIGAYEVQASGPLVVNTNTDVSLSGAGKLDLRTAIDLANVQAGADAITFDPTVFSTPQIITLTFGLLTLKDTATTTITAPGAGLLAVSGNHASGVFQINHSGSAALSGLTITAGSAATGGGLFNLGTAVVANCTISGNSSSGNGGGLSNFYIATLTDCTISGNSASNSGGGLFNLGAATLTDCTVSGNFSGLDGGGVLNYGAATLADCTVSGNYASRFGGGVYNRGGANAMLTDCTVSGNSASTNGGGVFNSGTATLTNCTVTANSAGGYGGGVFNQGGATATLTNCTVSANSASRSAGGVDNVGSSAVLLNTIVAANTGDGLGHPDVEGVFSSQGFNLIGVISGSSGWVTTDVTSFSAIDPHLGPLGYYGGLTQTMPLLPDSPAIGASDSLDGPDTDQRGFGRGFISDIGAFESQSIPLLVNTSADGELGKLDLRGAVGLANLQTGEDSITFDPTVFNTPQLITLTRGPLTLTDTATTTITGPGARLLSVSGNHASQVFLIYTGASAALSGLTITAGSALFGGGIVNAGTAMETGGGIDNAGTATLTDCAISGNSAFGNGGGVYNSGTATLVNCTVSANSSQYSGGGVYNPGTATLTNCTVSGNSAREGGGLANYRVGTAALTNCTVSANSASFGGGGVFNGGDGGTATLLNTIVAGNTTTVPSFGPDVHGGFLSNGGNLIGIRDGSFGFDADLIGTSGQPLDPLLAPLGNYGGPTQTMALLTGSRAINAGSPFGDPPTDQRGKGRNGAPDIGAFEYYTPSSQNISFNSLANRTYGDADFTISATASSTLPVSFTSGVNARVYQDTAGVWHVHILGAGSAAVTAHQIGNPIIASAPDVTQNFTIAKANAVIVVTPYTSATTTYDGQAHAATITSIRGVNGETGTTVGTVDLSHTTHTAAGTYASDSWSFAGANYNSIPNTPITDSIKMATATVVVTPYTVTYNGSPHTATITSINGVNGETGATVGTVALSSTHTTAGIYASDFWSFAGANYNSIPNTPITDTINQATATVVVTPYTVTYNGSPHTATITSINGVNGETGATVGTVSLSSTHTVAGTFDSDFWSFAGANYNSIPNTPITDTINQATATVVVTPYTVTYNGSPHTATITSINGVNGETGATVGTVSLSSTHTVAGTFDSDFWSFAGANYNSIPNTPITDTINKATATVVVAPYTVLYDGNSHTASITSITGVNGETGATVGSVTLSSTHTAAGIYASDFWSFTGAANYNNIANTPITDTITATPPVVTNPTATSVTSTIATLGGTVNSDGGASLLKRGILYTPSPVNLIPGGSGVMEVDSTSLATGIFIQNLTGLIPNTAYSFVAFATNVQGIAYSPVGNFTTTILGPVSSITGPTSGKPSDLLTFVLNGFDPFPGMQLGRFVFHITWGDGKSNVVTGLNGAQGTHAYVASGTYTIQVSATDAVGNMLPTATWKVTISSTPAANAVVSGGSSGTTKLLSAVTPQSAPGTIAATSVPLSKVQPAVAIVSPAAAANPTVSPVPNISSPVRSSNLPASVPPALALVTAGWAPSDEAINEYLAGPSKKNTDDLFSIQDGLFFGM